MHPTFNCVIGCGSLPRVYVPYPSVVRGMAVSPHVWYRALLGCMVVDLYTSRHFEHDTDPDAAVPYNMA